MCEETMDEMMYEWIIYWAVDKKSSEVYDPHCDELNFSNCAEIHLFDSYVILVYWFIHHGSIWTHKWPAPTICGFIAQLVRASAWLCKVAGANHVEVPSFSDFATQLLHKTAFNTVKSITVTKLFISNSANCL